MTLTSLVLLVGLLNWWLARRQTASVRRECQAAMELLRQAGERLAAAQEDLSALPAPPPAAFNVNRRPEASRRLRGNQSLEAISAGTGWSIPEVALLRKVEEMSFSSK